MNVHSLPRHPDYGEGNVERKPRSPLRIVFAFSLLPALAMVGHLWLFAEPWQTVSLPDVSQPFDIALQGAHCSTSNPPSGIELWISGEIAGEAEVRASNWKVENISGHVDLHAAHNWFDPQCLLQYRPKGMMNGSLTIRYRIR